MFADDVLLYAPANTLKECSSLQNDLTAISSWASRWQLKLNPTKCEAFMITNKRKPIPFAYSINHQPISWSNPVKYLGVQVDSKLNWSKHCKYVVSKGTKSLNYLRRSIFGCSRAAKCAAYKAIIRPTLEYAAVVCNPHNLGDIQLLESLQKRAARWICGSCWSPSTSSWTISSNDCCSQLHLPSLQSRRSFLSVSFLNDIYHQQTSITFNSHCSFNSIASTRSHHLSLVPPQSTITSRRYSFLPTQLSSGTLCHYISLKTVIESLFGITFIITYVSSNF